MCWTEKGNWNPWHFKAFQYHNLANHPSFHSTYLDLLYIIYSMIICVVFKDIFISLQSIETLENEIYLPYPNSCSHFHHFNHGTAGRWRRSAGAKRWQRPQSGSGTGSAIGSTEEWGGVTVEGGTLALVFVLKEGS